jgi:hypothetical protein
LYIARVSASSSVAPAPSLCLISNTACLNFGDNSSRVFARRSDGFRVSRTHGPRGLSTARIATQSKKLHCRARAAVVIKPVSANSLSKTGIFAEKAGDFRPFPPSPRQTGGPETKANARKARISGPFSRLLGSLAERRNGWLGREDSNLRMVESKSTALPLGDAPIDCLEYGGTSSRPNSSGHAGL